MKKIIISAILLSSIYSCKTAKPTSTGSPVSGNPTASTLNANIIKYSSLVTSEDLKEHLFVVASDEMGGRDTGTEGQKKAGKYLIDTYKKNKVSFPRGASDFYQKVPADFMNKPYGDNLPDSENIWAFVEGTEKPAEIVVISAHYDHIGTKNGEVYNGADDDGSGTVTLLELAKTFQKAKEEGNGPKRSILFLHVTGEEHGLHGSRYYSENPLFPLANTIVDINIDMIGRRDDFHKDTNNYVYLIGSDYLSTDLFKACEEANKYVNLKLDYKYNDKNDPNRFYYRSDHYNFAKHNIPSVFLFNGTHADYHKASDKPDKIEYDALAKRARLAFAIAWDMANRDKRPAIDKL